jgi:hypothetical protein
VRRSQSFSVVAILGYFQSFILILLLFYLGKLFLWGFLENKKESENSLKYGDNAPLNSLIWDIMLSNAIMGLQGMG